MNRLKVGICSLAFLSSGNCISGELSLSAGVGAEYIIQSIDDIDNNNEIDSDNLIIRPFLSAAYNARDLSLLLRATHNHVRRSLDAEDNTNNYTDFSYLANYQILRNLLLLRVNGSQSYNSQAANSFLVDDFLLNADNLRKNTSNSAALAFNLPDRNIVGINANLSVSKIESEINSNNLNDNVDARDFSNTSYGATVSIVNGQKSRAIIYRLDASSRLSERRSLDDFQNDSANAMLGVNITQDISMRLLGFYESTQIDNSELDASALREFYSYGAGFAWQPADNRFIELGWNRSNTSNPVGDQDEEDDFLSVDMKWNFTQRTSVSGSYSRRFFGDSGNFRFSHSLRNWRSQVSYSENVTTNSQLLLNEEQGLLVCANGSTDISDCSLSETLNPEDILPTDILIPTLTQSFELNDRVVIRKAWTAQSSIDLRRTTFTVAFTDGKNEEIEVNRTTLNKSLRLAASITPSAHSTITLQTSYSDLDRRFDGESQSSIVKEASIEYERRLTRRLFATLGYRYLDSQGDTFGGASGIRGINGPLTDRRISAEIRYEFNSNN